MIRFFITVLQLQCIWTKSLINETCAVGRNVEIELSFLSYLITWIFYSISLHKITNQNLDNNWI